MDLSVVVPVFNVEKYLRRCLDSIFFQDYAGNFEVIAIDDASTDLSCLILEEYSKKYNNFKFIRLNVNSSLAVARRKGIEVSLGKYILNIDSDDWLKQGTFKKLFEYVDEYNSPDAIAFNHERNNGNLALREEENQIKTRTIVNYKNKDSVQSFFMGGTCKKMVKRSLTQNLIYGENYMNTTEDLIFCTEVFIKSQTILIVPEKFYCYFVNQKSLTFLITPERYLKSQFLVYELLTQIKEKYELDNKYVNAIDEYLYKLLVLEIFKGHFVGLKVEILNELKEKYNQFSLQNTFAELEKLHNSIFYAVKKIGFKNALSIIIRLKFRKYVWNLYNQYPLLRR